MPRGQFRCSSGLAERRRGTENLKLVFSGAEEETMGGSSLPDTVRVQVENFEASLRNVQEKIGPVVDVMRDKEALDGLSSVDSARLHIAMAFAANSLFYMYLKTQGVDPSQHPVREELERIKGASVKLRNAVGVEDERQPKSKLDLEASSRFIAAGVSESKENKKRIREAGEKAEKKKKKRKKGKK